jgi:hypothetical protein
MIVNSYRVVYWELCGGEWRDMTLKLEGMALATEFALANYLFTGKELTSEG